MHSRIVIVGICHPPTHPWQQQTHVTFEPSLINSQITPHLYLIPVKPMLPVVGTLALAFRSGSIIKAAMHLPILLLRWGG